MKNVIYMLAIAVLLIGGCNSTQESSSRTGYDFSAVDKVAIVAVEGTVRSEAARDQIADFFAMELLKKGYAPMGRAQVRALLKEQVTEPEELTTPEGAIEAGQLLNVPGVLTIEIPHFSEEIAITSKLINVEDGSILWLASGSGKAPGSFPDIFWFASGEQADAGIGLGGEDDRLLGGPIDGGPIGGGPMGGVLGSVSGQALTTKEAKKAQSIVKKMCSSLPSKVLSEL